MIKKQLFPISNTDNRAGILILPADYDTNPELCPLVVFSHGTGEAGDGTVNTLDSLYNNGSPLALARDGKLNTITCPITGKTYRPIVFGLQGTAGWCVRPADTVYAIQQLIKTYPKIDPDAIMITGLSAGGENTFEMAGGTSAGLFAAAWPMSSPAINTGAVSWSVLRAKIWATHGQQDTGLTDFNNSVRTVDAVNALKKGFACLTLTNDGHGGWAALYDPAFKVVLPGCAGGKAINGYEFLLACKNSQFTFTASGTGTGGTNTNPVATTTKAIAAVSASGTTVTLDGSASTTNGGISSAGWYISDAAGKYVKPWIISGAMDTGKGIVPKAVITLPVGAYNVRLTIQDVLGKQDVTTVPLTVGTVAPTGPTVVGTFTDAAGVAHTAYSDNTWK